MTGYLDLYDFRISVTEMYGARHRALKLGNDAAETAREFRRRRDQIFATHPQSALDAEQKAAFHGLDYFPYDPAFCVQGILDAPIQSQPHRVQLGGDEIVTLAPAATVRFELLGQVCALSLYWIDVYGGGLFLPFRDLTAPAETYGGGRYLVDTVKGSDFNGRETYETPSGHRKHRVLVDFNYAYNPSCAYNPRWVCPLAPRENHLPLAIRAGEKRFS